MSPGDAKQSPRLSEARADGLARRIRALREAKGSTRQAVADALGWSLSRMVNYESGTTEPTVSDLAALAAVFSVAPAELAFGSMGAAAPPDLPTRIAWIREEADGEPLAIPSSFLEGLPLGPYRGAVLQIPGFGLSAGDILILRPGSKPSAGQLWAVRGADGHLRVTQVVKSGRKGLDVALGLMNKPEPVAKQALVGQLVATISRVFCPP